MKIKKASDMLRFNNNKLIKINDVAMDILKKLDLNTLVVSTACDTRDNRIELSNKLGDVVILILNDNLDSIKSIYSRNLYDGVEPVDITPLTGCFIIDDINYVISSYISKFKTNIC